MIESKKIVVPIPTVKRFPSYLRILRQCQNEGMEYISATVLADELGLKPIQVRKDISYTGIEGKPKVGFVVDELIDYITHSLGWDNSAEALIVGVGNLGKAISMYEGFEAYGLSIVAAFDNDPNKIGTKVGSLVVRSTDDLKSFIEESGIKIAVITVPASCAQGVADNLVKCGIKGIWNFAPKRQDWLHKEKHSIITLSTVIRVFCFVHILVSNYDAFLPWRKLFCLYH